MANLSILVTAHPDDECMFFLPSIRSVQKSSKLWLLCLTTGNCDGLGEVRKYELLAVTERLQLDKLLVVDDDNLPDHMTRGWNIEYASMAISRKLQDLATEMAKFDNIQFITFDSHGISGHLNHIDTYQAVKSFCDARNYPLWCLTTQRNLVVKYCPCSSWFMLGSLWTQYVLAFFKLVDPPPTSRTSRCGSTITHYLLNPSLNWECMALHQSQFVWYRRLFVICSCYTYFNRLKRSESEKEKGD